MKVREIAETIGISKERVGYILHDELGHEKALRKMGAALANSRSKTHSHENLLNSAWSVLTKNKTGFCASIYYSYVQKRSNIFSECGGSWIL